MQYIAILRLLLSLLPVIVAAVDAVEKLLPEGGKGAQKLEMVKVMIQHAHDFSESVGVTFEQFWPVVEKLVAAIVAVRK